MLIQAPMGISDGNCLSMFMRALDFSPRTMRQTVLVRDTADRPGSVPRVFAITELRPGSVMLGGSPVPAAPIPAGPRVTCNNPQINRYLQNNSTRGSISQVLADTLVSTWLVYCVINYTPL